MNNQAKDLPGSVAQRVRAAIKVAKAGDKRKARQMLLDIVENEPTEEDAWLWLAGFSDDPEDAKAYLETVLALNPTHARAIAGLHIIEQRIASAPPQSAAARARPQKRICKTCGDPISDDRDECPACADSLMQFGQEGAAPRQDQWALEEASIGVSQSASNVNAEIAPSFTLTVEQAESIDACLERMAYESEASCIILADITGQLISERGRTDGMNTQVLSALAAGELSATQEMARLVGERARFSLLLHEGAERSVYLSPVGTKMLLIVVFAGQTPIGLVRIILKNAVEELGPILERPATQRSDENLGQALSGDFAQQLEDEIDASLDILIS
jgi:predicted regulator of Ras-like GTPase activity (Roadblock/LC7/MglB family)